MLFSPGMTADLSAIQWLAIITSALLIGISKTGIPGVSIVAIPLLAATLPARVSTGFVLPMLIMADLFAVTWYRRQAHWRHLTRLLPWGFGGIVAGWLVMGRISDRQLRPVIGVIILVLLAINLYLRLGRDRAAGAIAPPPGRWRAAGIGLLAGLASMLANAAGPIIVVYLAAARLPKTIFIGTVAWCFFIINWMKTPFSANLGLITRESLKINFILLPVIALGALAGVFMARRMSQRVFAVTVEGLAALAALRLLFG